jgi:hypothetical protein
VLKTFVDNVKIVGKVISTTKIKPLVLIVVLLLIVSEGAFAPRTQLQTILFNLTGEESLLPQISGVIQYGLTRLQPPLQTADDAPVQHAGMNPYGVNTFLQNEVEPAKREEAMRLIAEAGIKWIRQEFPWEDIEIHGKGNFEDRRHEPHQSAWAKYDHIVELAEKYDINIMARLSNPPAWTRALTNTVGSFAPPDNLADYGDFVEAVATRYKGRIPAYQIWNEPNIYPEWGEYPISAEEYTELLKEGYTRIKAIDPDAIVVMGALAATIELDRARRYAPDGALISPGGLSDVLFLQQMYDTGAAPYFDVLAMQGYGLWSGPTDRRMQPRVLNFSRPLYIRDVMVRNGDAHKAIWLSELGWNALPPDSGLPPVYGQVTAEQQARYAAIAYRRMQREWPWLGVGFYWFFKQADDRERDINPQYYFRMVEPDFTPLPVYQAIKEQVHQPPVMYPGRHGANHWAVTYKGNWELQAKALHSANPGDSATFTFEGSGLSLLLGKTGGRVSVQIDDSAPVELTPDDKSPQVVASSLVQKPHSVGVEVREGPVEINGFIVESRPSLTLSRVGSAVMVLATVAGVWVLWKFRRTK